MESMNPTFIKVKIYPNNYNFCVGEPIDGHVVYLGMPPDDEEFEQDKLAIFEIGWININQALAVTSVMERFPHFTFRDVLVAEGTYQICYLESNETVVGVSKPFTISEQKSTRAYDPSHEKQLSDSVIFKDIGAFYKHGSKVRGRFTNRWPLPQDKLVLKEVECTPSNSMTFTPSILAESTINGDFEFDTTGLPGGLYRVRYLTSDGNVIGCSSLFGVESESKDENAFGVNPNDATQERIDIPPTDDNLIKMTVDRYIQLFRTTFESSFFQDSVSEFELLNMRPQQSTESDNKNSETTMQKATNKTEATEAETQTENTTILFSLAKDNKNRETGMQAAMNKTETTESGSQTEDTTLLLSSTKDNKNSETGMQAAMNKTETTETGSQTEDTTLLLSSTKEIETYTNKGETKEAESQTEKSLSLAQNMDILKKREEILCNQLRGCLTEYVILKIKYTNLLMKS